MTDIKRLLSWFDSGALVRPSADALNFTDLARALASLAGVGGLESTPGVERLRGMIGPADHIVFVLFDGFGMDHLAQAPEGGFLKTHFAAELQPVFPSTTAAALTTLATCAWPAEHAVPGWWLYLERFKVSATTLRFVERFSEAPLDTLGIRIDDVFPLPGVWRRMTHAPLTIIGKWLVDSVYTRYAVGDTPRQGYEHTAEGFEAVRTRVVSAASPTFTYFYVPHIDALCHERGSLEPGIAKLIADLDAHLAKLAADLAGRARIVVSADHGGVDVPRERGYIIKEGGPLAECLVCPPSGEPVVPVFHVKRGRNREFVRRFAERFGEDFALITPGEAERLALFGPKPLSPVMRRRLGSYIAVASPPAAVYYDARGAKPVIHIGVHAGLSRAEMRIPLILA